MVKMSLTLLVFLATVTESFSARQECVWLPPQGDHPNNWRATDPRTEQLEKLG